MQYQALSEFETHTDADIFKANSFAVLKAAAGNTRRCCYQKGSSETKIKKEKKNGNSKNQNQTQILRPQPC